ncbi:pyridoxal phosphate-dependent aminotransferase [Leptospira sp. 96542]|nr:pyridoxal phosphate-dependent aminotransferase [Leptospira sp. 96542]
MDLFLSNRFSKLGEITEENLLNQKKNELILNNKHVLDLVVSNPTTVGLEFPPHLLSHSFESVNLSLYDPKPEGSIFCRDAIQKDYLGRGLEINSEQITLTASTSEAYSFLFKLLTNPGDEILTPNPGYPLFSFLSGLENLKEVNYPLLYDNNLGEWNYDAETIANCISTKTKLIILVSPANPTGSRTSQTFWDEWRHLNIQIPVILDEVFVSCEFSGQNHTFPSNPIFPLFVLGGISKLLALPQWKLAWILSLGSDTMQDFYKPYLHVITDTYLSVNSIVQSITPDLFQWKQFVQNRIKSRIQRNLGITKEVLSFHPNMNVLYSGAGWYCLLEVNSEIPDENLALQILCECLVYIHPGSWYGFPNSKTVLVLSLIGEEEKHRDAILKLQDFFK